MEQSREISTDKFPGVEEDEIQKNHESYAAEWNADCLQ
jgi:hypothetical protein